MGDRMESEKLAEFLDALDYMLDASGLRERAATAPRMPLESEAENVHEFPAASAG